MLKPATILGVLAVLFICESSGRFIHPTYKPPPTRPPIYRFRRSDDQPLWLYKGDVPKAPSSADHPFLPKYIDDIKLDPNTRVARSLSTPRASRGGGTRQSSSRDTGPTHPGYNRRNARDATKPIWPTLPPFIPTPLPPRIPARKPETFRFRRSEDQPLWLYSGDMPKAPSSADHPFLPKYIDDIKLDPNRRVARSLNRDTMPWPTLPPFNPHPSGPKHPWDSNPGHHPIYV